MSSIIEEYLPYLAILVLPPEGWKPKSLYDLPYLAAVAGPVPEIVETIDGKPCKIPTRFKTADVACAVCLKWNVEPFSRGDFSRWAVPLECFGSPAIGDTVAAQYSYRIIPVSRGQHPSEAERPMV